MSPLTTVTPEPLRPVFSKYIFKTPSVFSLDLRFEHWHFLSDFLQLSHVFSPSVVYTSLDFCDIRLCIEVEESTSQLN